PRKKLLFPAFDLFQGSVRILLRLLAQGSSLGGREPRTAGSGCRQTRAVGIKLGSKLLLFFCGDLRGRSLRHMAECRENTGAGSAFLRRPLKLFSARACREHRRRCCCPQKVGALPRALGTVSVPG